jgi:dinuclear metal center YbgI/SA1388 family protein
MTARVGDWVAALDALYPPGWAQDWDAVGLVTGDPEVPADRALFAVDPTLEVVAEAADVGAQLLVTHHPLLLRGVTGVPVTTVKGRIVTELIRRDIALFVAHTNADAAPVRGVSDSLARALGLESVQPLAAEPPEPAYKIVTFVPDEFAGTVIDALAAAGAGQIGDYSRCAWTTEGTGTFVAGAGANPTAGERGAVTEVPERRVEMVLPQRALRAVVAALMAAHPYEEPAYDVLPTVAPHDRGIGRVGELVVGTTLGAFGRAVARALPPTPAGIRVSGDLDQPVRRVAVCGGAGDSFIGQARAAGADVYVTADLRHHPAQEAGLALVDAGHWATEWPWLADAAAAVLSALGDRGHTVGADVSELVTDPWTASLATTR